jgi:hypothetical protein
VAKNLEGISFKECEVLLSFFQNGSKEFHNLRLHLQELLKFIGQLNALQNLHLDVCSNLQELLESIGQLNALENLDLWGCLSLQQLPTSIGQLNTFQNLHL